jgi:hypothetical protein
VLLVTTTLIFEAGEAAAGAEDDVRHHQMFARTLKHAPGFSCCSSAGLL